MTRRLARVVAAPTWSAVLLLLSAASVAAQDAATNFEELRVKVGSGATIYITERAGDEYTARVVSVSATALVVDVDGKGRELTESAVLRIRQRLPDSLWAGGLIGLGIGLGLGALAAGASESCSYEGGAECAGPAIMTGLIGGGIGLGIDALIKGRKVIYQAPSQKPVAWRLAPMVRRGMAGGRLTFGF